MKKERIETDVLIIGGGTAGCFAAYTLGQNTDADILIAEKANIKRSGCLAAGVNAINAYITKGRTPQDYVDYCKKDAKGIVREDLLLTLSERLNHVTEVLEQKGLVILKDENGEYVTRGNRNIKINGENTDIMKTQALKQALDKYGFTAAFGGGRRDEEKSRAKERIFSFRNSAHAWDPKNQRPEMWKLFNTRLFKGEEVRVFPLSNWTEKDIWQYIQREKIEIPSLYFAKERPIVERDGNIIMVDDERMKERLLPGEEIQYKKVRFRTLGCYPLTGGVESDADTLDAIIEETLSAVSSERTTRVIDNEAAGSMERRKREGYF